MCVQWWRVGTWQGLIMLVVLLGSLIPYTHAELGDETDGPLRLTLAECIQRALENHPSIQEVKWDVAMRSSDLQQAKAGYYPTAEFVNLAGVVNDAAVAPATGLVVSPAVPVYHWKVSGPVPVAATLSVAVDPDVMVLSCGCVVIDGAVLPPPAGANATPRSTVLAAALRSTVAVAVIGVL